MNFSKIRHQADFDVLGFFDNIAMKKERGTVYHKGVDAQKETGYNAHRSFLSYTMSLNRLIKLAQRTGDRLIVHDPINGRDIVLMGIGAYEELLDKAEDFVEENESWDGRDIEFDEDDDYYAPWNGGGMGSSMTDDSWNRAGDVLADRYDDLPDVGNQNSNISHPTSDIPDWDSPFATSSQISPVQPSSIQADDIPIHNEEPLTPEQPKDENEPIFYEEPIV